MRGLCLLALLAVCSSARAGDEILAELIATIQHVELTPGDTLPRYRAFAEKHATQPLGDLARLLAATHMLTQPGARPDPAPILEWLDSRPIVPREPTTLDAPLAQIERSIRAHLAMAQLVRAVRLYHRRHVEFPPSLQAVVDAKLVDAALLTDPFGSAFEYAAKARASAPDLPRQDFTLRCASLDLSDDQLAATYARLADPVKDVVLRSTQPDAGEAFAADLRKDGTVGAARQWKVGAEQHGLTLLAVLDGAAVVGYHGLPRVLVVRER